MRYSQQTLGAKRESYGGGCCGERFRDAIMRGAFFRGLDPAVWLLLPLQILTFVEVGRGTGSCGLGRFGGRRAITCQKS